MPSHKLTIDGVDYTDCKGITIINRRPENNYSTLEFTIPNRYSTDIVEFEDTVSLALQRKTPELATTFTGEVYALQPSLLNPKTVTCYCKGFAHCMEQTHSDSSWGIESLNPTKYTPREIIQDLADNYVENSFGDAETTNWTINTSDTYVDNVHNGLSVTNLTSKYLNNLTILNRLAEIVNAYAITLGTPEPGIHWFERPDSTNPRIYVKEIGDDHSNGDWDKYYGGSQTAATVKEGVNLIDFVPHQTMQNYANNVILAASLRKPAYDYWTEDAATNGIWTVETDGSVADDAAAKVVGADSTKFVADASRLVKYYFNFDNNLDLTYMGSHDNIPTIGFYAKRYASNPTYVYCNLYTTRGTDYFQVRVYSDATGYTDLIPTSGDWYGITIPIGPFYKNYGGGGSQTTWTEVGTPDWTDLDGIEFAFNNTGVASENYFWLDDLHLSGHIIREARDAGAIDTDGDRERQVFLRLDTAIDDSCVTSDNTGTAARLAASELFKRSQFKTTAANRHLTGTAILPMMEDLLPGQQLYVNAGKQLNGNYQYQLDMRCLEVTHKVSTQGYVTEATVTSDLWNSHVFGTPNAWGIVQANAGALGHAEARDLKASGVDLNIPRLTWDPTA